MKTLVLFFTLFTLFTGILYLSSDHSNAYAQNDSDSNILYNIAIQADQQIKNQLDIMYGDSIPENLEILYDNGHASVESLKEALSNDIEKAQKDFLDAMHYFKQISQIISIPNNVVNSQSEDETSRDHQSEKNRLQKHVQKLKIISDKYHTGIDFKEIDNLFIKVQEQIDTNTGNPSEILDQLNNLIQSIEKNIREHASYSSSDRIKLFIEKHVDLLEIKLDEMSEVGDADSIQVDNANALIAKIHSSLSNDQIDDAKNEFRSLLALIKNIERSIE